MLVSAIIPTYNRAKTIARTLDSVLAQTWKELEIIVVDDGSTDNTAELLRSYGNRIRVIQRKNGGPSAARNTGIKAASGEIITFLDSDDTWLPAKTERQVALLEHTREAGAVCCICDALMHYKSGDRTSFEIAGFRPSMAEGLWRNPVEFLLQHFLLFNQVSAVWREALEQSGYFREDLPWGLNDDYDLSVRLALVGPWAVVNEPLVEWHEHGDNISNTHRELEICRHTQRILEDIGQSPRFKPVLPASAWKTRLRMGGLGIRARTWQSSPRRISRLMGHSAWLGMRAHGFLSRRFFPSNPPQFEKIEPSPANRPALVTAAPAPQTGTGRFQ